MKPHQVFFFLLLIFLPTQLGFHFWPAWTQVLGRRVDYLSPTIYFTDILVVLTLVLWWFEKKHRKEHVAKILIPLLVFVGINIYFSASQPVALYKWVKVLEFGFLGWYIVKTKPKISLLAFPLSIAVFYSSVLAIAQFILQHSLGGPLWFLGERTFTLTTPGIARVVLGGRELLRPYATFPHPNVLGGFLAATLPLLINELTDKKKYFYITTLVIGALALALTFSRSAIIVGALGISGVYFLGKKKLYPVLLLVSAAFALVFFLIPLSPSDESFVVRQELNSAAIHLWQSAPWVGVGLGNFLVRLPQILPSRQIYFLQPVHNIYLLLLSEIGIVGVVLFALLLWKGIRCQARLPARQVSRIKTEFLIPLVVLLLLGLVDHYPATLQQGQLLLTIFFSATIASCEKG